MISSRSFRRFLGTPADWFRLATRRRRLRAHCRSSRPLRVVLGAGGVAEPGWVITDIDLLNIASERDWRRIFSTESIDVLLAEHVWEHLEADASRRAARNCFAFLREGGYLRAAVPDGLHPDPDYRNWVRPGGNGPGADDHKIVYDYRSFAALFRDCGFRVELLEYFDETGSFVFRPWSLEGGRIRRSSRFDTRNDSRAFAYTSVILDAIKDPA